jgi:peptidoglycan/xylan/chitin deacetylase (PgdA/CDA1 family)
LTFDNGPLAGATERILDILAARSILATFFLVGKQLSEPAHRRLAQRTRSEGHWIGNHSMWHGPPLGWSEDPDHVEHEIAAADEAIGTLAHPDRLLRPPGKAMIGPHLLSRAALDYVVDHEMTVVTWTTLPREGEEPKREWIDRAFRGLKESDWPVMVVHDHHLDSMMDTLPDFLDRALDQGFTFVQDFPDVCVPVRRGRIQHPIDTFVTERP